MGGGGGGRGEQREKSKGGGQNRGKQLKGAEGAEGGWMEAEEVGWGGGG